MQLGLSTAAFYGRWETEESAAQMARWGVDCAEVFLETYSEYTRAFGTQVHRALCGIPCTSIHPQGTQFENGLTGRSAKQRRDARDMLCRVLDAGQALGAHVYVCHGRHTALLSPLPWDMQANADMLGIMGEEAAVRGMVIGWENVCWCQLTTPQRVEVARQALPGLHFTLDIKQAMRAGCDPLDFVRAMGGGLCNVHVCDWDARGRLCLPGEGTFDFAALCRALRRTGYDGPVIIEPYLALIRSDEALLRSVAFMRRQIEEAEGESTEESAGRAECMENQAAHIDENHPPE